MLRRDAATRQRDPDDQRKEFSSSEYAKTIHGIVAGAPPAIDLAAEKRLIDCLVQLASEKAILSAHDASDGGMPYARANHASPATGFPQNV